MLGGALFTYYDIVLFGTWSMTLGVNVVAWIKARMKIDANIKRVCYLCNWYSTILNSTYDKCVIGYS